MWIERAVSKRLLTLSKQFPALLLTGARQTGKTSLLKHLFPAATYVSFDLPSLAEQAETNPDTFLKNQAEPIVLDEIQYVPHLFRHLKSVIDEKRHTMGRFIMTGSQKFPLMKSLSESLSGRCAVLELEPLSAQEIQNTPSQPPQSDIQVLWRGGFPELYRNPEIDPRNFYQSYVASYLERDVRSLLRVGSLRDFERFVRGCALRSGQLLNLTDLARDIGIAGTTARDWISTLEASNQILLLEPYFGNLGKRMIKTPKLYLKDTGLLCFFLGIDSPEAVGNSPMVGAIWETFILNELVKAKEAAGSSARIFFWRDTHGVEVDFVLEHQGKLRLIEAKWAENIRDLRMSASIEKIRSLLGKRDRGEHWIVCRTAHSHLINDKAYLRVLNGFRFHDWFSESTSG